MKRLLTTALMVAAGIGFAAPASASAAYLHQAECRDALQGYPTGNDNDFESAHQAINNNWGTRAVNTYQWGFYTRYSDNYMRQDFLVYRSDGVFQVIAKCNDTNLSGQIGSSEDYWTVIAKQ